MSRRAIILLTVVAAISVACTGVVWAQDSERTQKPGSESQQSAESGVVPGHYIVVLEDKDSGGAAAEASADRRQAGRRRAISPKTTKSRRSPRPTAPR